MARSLDQVVAHHASNRSWLGTSYLLSTATFTPLYGRLADIMGRRGAALLACSLFTVGTAICGLAPSMMSLIIGRLVCSVLLLDAQTTEPACRLREWEEEA